LLFILRVEETSYPIGNDKKDQKVGKTDKIG